MFLKSKKQRIAVKAFVFDPNNKVLLLRRAENDSRPGEWEVPGGGVEFGEEPFNAVVREVKEEAGLDIFIADMWGVSSVFSSKGDHIIQIILLCGLQDINQRVVLSKEHTDFSRSDWKDAKIQKLSN